MAELDPNIILDAGKIQGPNPSDTTQGLVSMFGLAAAIKKQQQDTLKQNTLLKIFSDPNNVDTATGLPTPKATAQLMPVDPDLAIRLRDANLDSQVKRAQLQHYQTDAGKANFDFMAKTAGIGMDAYDATIQGGKTQQQAAMVGQAARNEAVKNNGGAISDDVADGIVSKPFDPAGARFMAMTDPDFLADKKAEQAAKAEADRIKEQQRRDDISDKRADAAISAANNKGWSDPYTTKDGKTISINKNTGETREIKGVDGLQKVGAAGSGASFTPKMGELMAATAEQGVSLPTGFRSKAQQVELYQGLLDRNPDKSADEIAKMLKTGQIEFGAQKKETQTAANIAGKVQVFANELDKNMPLLRKAAQDVPRGNWTDLNKLLQTGDEHISDPKLKTLKGYINSTLQAYDGLGSRGGMDKDKREANRKLLLAADGPEAFEAQLKVFENEAKIAKESAYEATKSPELDDPNKNTASIAVPTSKAAYDALPSGARYSKPGDAPGTYRVKP